MPFCPGAPLGPVNPVDPGDPLLPFSPFIPGDPLKRQLLWQAVIKYTTNVLISFHTVTMDNYTLLHYRFWSMFDK